MGYKLLEVSKFTFDEIFVGKAQRGSDASPFLLGTSKGLIELGKGAGALAVQD
jgi:hypothetical protein